MRIVLLVAVFWIAYTYHSGNDDNHIPYRLAGYNVWVYDSNSGRDIFGGFVESSYLSRNEGLFSCEYKAKETASENYLSNWRYVCCTTTSEASCKTKVR